MSRENSPRNSYKDSPKGLSKSPSIKQFGTKDWEKRSMMIGTSVDNLKRAMQTYGNEVGPGQYESPTLIGRG